MKKLLINIVISGFVSIIIESLIISGQYFYQCTQEDVSFIYLGFPFEFYYFLVDFEIHGGIADHFIYDALASFLCSFMLVSIVARIIIRRRNQSSGETLKLIDEILPNNQEMKDL